MSRTVGIIPARYGSTRLPGKPLVSILGQPMIFWVWDQARRAKNLDRVVVATDDNRVKKAVEKFGGEAVITSPKHTSGSDRVAEVARSITCDIVVNIQGDEPLISPSSLDRLVDSLLSEKDVNMATLVTPIQNRAKISDLNVVKAVFDKDNNALYFSRFLQPYTNSSVSKSDYVSGLSSYYAHIGVYAYRKSFLLKFTGWKPGNLEKLEKLEQLRVLENGYHIKIVKTVDNTHHVDRAEDIREVEKILRKRNEV
jgi:3-deoxy-manno-octulosonate cytidylyltransferase (CMP-KDO synthetase)